ncbi:antibiotic biosynthesis monooxygenase [Streptomyces sp. JJ66]|uniref:putative quinol monooxygenase n=1 Tax=Streptomyces sp. JJ66 TaxID=2803843 RepID=UPI001C5693B6|nr:putative quinol monooxygenase [Streptomyces sp. JJ66]MBW1604411.1 antibiotic biosynthesis monooxygenase [Streptomyces sp. JJ66]
MSGVGLVVRFELRDEDAATRFDALTEATVAAIRRTEPGTLVYLVHRVPHEPLMRVFYEWYADRPAFDAHERQPHVRTFLRQRDAYLTNLEVTFLLAPYGKGPGGD